MPSGGALEPGRYSIERGPWTAQTYSFEVPAGWEVEDGGQTVTKYSGAPDLELGFSVSIVDELYGEPCGANQTIALRQTSEALYMALRERPGLALSTPDYLAIGGRSGLYMEITVADGVELDDCDPPSGLQIWLDRTGNNAFVLHPEFVTFIHSLDAERKRLLASEGELFVLVAWFSPNTDEEDVVELEAIIDSIAFVH